MSGSASPIPFRITDRFQVEETGITREGRSCVRLLSPLEYRVGHADSDEAIIVPAGFVSDFASVPWFADGLIPSFGPHARPAIIHDALYEWAGVVPRGRTYTRKEADGIFLEAMGVVGVSWLRRSTMYRAVRLGGRSGWGKR